MARAKLVSRVTVLSHAMPMALHCSACIGFLAVHCICIALHCDVH